LATHLPPAIFLFLFGIVLIGSMLIGTTLASALRRQWFYRIVIATVLSSTLYTIMDMEYPQLGAVNLLQESDAQLVSLRKFMR
jgi:predicted membrane channel-forming protein YqfA (hemolysin III family)